MTRLPLVLAVVGLAVEILRRTVCSVHYAGGRSFDWIRKECPPPEKREGL